MSISIDILNNDERYSKFDQVIDLLFCVSSVIFAFAIPFQFRFTPWIGHWFFAVLIFKLYYTMRGKESLVSINLRDSIAIFSLGLYGLWALLSTSWSLDPENTHKLALDWLSSLLIIPGIHIFSSKRLPITLMMKAYVCGSTALIIFALTDLTETALNGDIEFYLFARDKIMRHIASVTYHHIYLSFIIGVSLFISSRFLFDPRTPISEKLFYIIHSVLALFILAINNSRIVTLALFISVFVFFVCQIKKNKKLAFSLLITFAILILIFIVFPTRLGESVMKIAESGDADDPRFHIWKSLIVGLKDVPFLGYGYSAVDNVYADLFQKAGCWFALVNHYSTHNQFMESYFTLGFIGLILIVAFIVGLTLLLIKKKSMLLASMLILLLVSMTFEIPFCHCFAIPLLISWFVFCHSGKNDMAFELPKLSFTIPAIVVAVYVIMIATDSCKSAMKYSTINEIEITDYSQRKFTKKWLKKYKIKEDNIDMIICKGETGTIHTQKDYALDIRNYAYTNTLDTLVVSFDYYISQDFGANNININAHLKFPNSLISYKAFDLNERNVWKSDSLIIMPSCTKVVSLKNNQVEKRRTINTPCLVSVQTKLNDAKTFNNLKGYALLRNMKIQPLNKQYGIDRKE
ncbi:MAG: O-antigen ligase family protein [Bacteroidales bacterium]|nr:O-antigen ligase family protein [Candidatus Scybalocola fimicaballi]